MNSDQKIDQRQKWVISFSTILMFVLFVGGCKPEAHITVYAGDILEVNDIGNKVAIPIRLKLPIMTADECGDDQNKILPPLERYGNNVRFIRCETVSGEMYDYLVSEMDVNIVQKSQFKDDKSFGMFVIIVSEDPDKNLLIELVTTKSVQNAVSAIDQNYVVQTIKLDDIDLNIVVNNDTRNPVIFEIDGSFVDGNPIDVPTRFELSRRLEIEVIPSNVRSKSIILNGIGRLGRIINS